MKKTTIILLTLAWASTLMAQNAQRSPWSKITISPEFVHNIVQGYYFGSNAILLDHPNNSAVVKVTYDFGRYWTLAAYGGLSLCHRSTEGMETVRTDHYSGLLSRSRYVNEPRAHFGLEAQLHLLPLFGVNSQWFDLYGVGRVGSTTQDLDLSLGLGLAYWPWPWGGVYANISTGSVGFPYGFLEEEYPHFQLRTGVSFRL